MSNSLTLQYPDALDIDHSDILFHYYDLVTRANLASVCFDLSRTAQIYPFGIILVTCAIQGCLSRKIVTSYIPPNDKRTKSFLINVGFNKFFNLPDTNDSGLERNVQLQHENLQLARRTGVDPVLLDQIVEVFKYHLRLSQGIRGSLRLSFNEAITNVIDHSESTGGYYVCAQSYPEEKQLIVCITDPGIGILRSLKKSKNYSRLRNDCSAIEKAVLEGVTSRIGFTAGLGLNHILKFAKVNEGKVYILSGSGKVMWNFRKGKEKIRSTKTKQAFQGTIINIVINIDKEGLYFLASEESPIFD